MLIEPDEFVFIIEIEEYWKEEFVKKKIRRYKDKVGIQEIESALMGHLNSLGIQNKDVRSTEVGNFWRSRGPEFLISKRLEVKLTDFQLINQIIAKLDMSGIQYMRIGELKNKEIYKYRKEVKKRALLAAKEKAAYLLETLDKKLGDVISIREIPTNDYIWSNALKGSNTALSAPNSSQADNNKKIKLRFEINAKFGIKE